MCSQIRDCGTIFRLRGYSANFGIKAQKGMFINIQIMIWSQKLLGGGPAPSLVPESYFPSFKKAGPVSYSWDNLENWLLKKFSVLSLVSVVKEILC